MVTGQPIVVIDPRSSGRDLVEELHRTGSDVTVVQPREVYRSTPGRPVPAPGPEILAACDRPGRSPGERLPAIVPGCEHAVTIADIAAAQWGSHHNDLNTLAARRHKVAMAEAASSAGILTPWTVECRDVGQVARTVEARPAPWVVKPSDSGGSDGARVCRSLEEAKSAAAAILGQTTLLGHVADSLTVQEYLDGEQHFVNTVSGPAGHVVTEVFRYVLDETSGHPEIRAAVTMSVDDPRSVAAVDYVLPVLDAVGFRWGASHTEVRATSAGTRLIEFNGRAMGPTVPSQVYRRVAGHSQITELAAMLRDPWAYHRPQKLAGRRLVGWYMLAPQHPGTVTAVDASLLTSIRGVTDVRGLPQPGHRVTTDNRVTTGSFGMIFFGADSDADADRIMTELRELELAGRAVHIDREETLV
ncbi:hypothetical protein VV01_18810 [Luteipulveratus halotolerans]|uniref:ATP-grasp domain-containing protein n=1 Tax=Luteipulveratus halotolerans TaxID=1631356 RepID=A0A0L6CLQ1_9MICO|nr:hypothetical protein VV01_18810 [Luteipulveratus halotolerans]